MYVTAEAIVLVGSVLGVIGTVIGMILKVHKWYLRQEELIAEVNSLREHHKEDIDRVNTENTLVCYALSACLDGLGQLGANHTVTDAKNRLDKHLNKQAHQRFEED